MIEFLELLENQNYSAETLRSYKKDIEDFNNYIIDNTGKLDYNLTERQARRYLYFLSDKKYSNKTISRKISSIRSFMNFLTKRGRVKTNHFTSIESPKISKRLPKIISEKDVMFLLDNMDKRGFLNFRNYIIIDILYSCGFRVSELVNIKLSNIFFNRSSILVRGKGNKERVMPMHNTLSKNLKKYINTYRKKALEENKVEEHGYLLINYKGNKLSDRSVRNILNKEIEILDDVYYIHPHMLRHTFATTMLDSGADLRVVQEMLGHSSLKSTQIYTQVSVSKVALDFESKHPRKGK